MYIDHGREVDVRGWVGVLVFGVVFFLYEGKKGEICGISEGGKDSDTRQRTMSTMPRYFSVHGASSALVTSRTGAQRMLLETRILAASTMELVEAMVITHPCKGSGKSATLLALKKALNFASLAMLGPDFWSRSDE